MKIKNSQLKKITKIAVPILKKNGVTKAGIFGSYAKEEHKKRRDIDMPIQVKNKKFNLFDLIGLQQELEKKLGKKVDLLTYKGLSPYIKEHILNDEVRII